MPLNLQFLNYTFLYHIKVDNSSEDAISRTKPAYNQLSENCGNWEMSDI